jgi:hypothetical protein
MFNIGAVFPISEKQLRWFSDIVGLLFVGIAAYIRLTAVIPDKTFFVLAIPLFTGIAMLLASTLVKRLKHLQMFYVDSMGCRAHLFSEAWCQ